MVGPSSINNCCYFGTSEIMFLSKIQFYFCIIPSTDRRAGIKGVYSEVVSALFFSCCPSAIIRRIISIVVNTINAVEMRWSLTHIFVKVFKRVYPSGANLDSSATIAGIVFTFGVITSRFHPFPCVINLCLGHSVGAHGNNLQAKVASIWRGVASWMLEAQRFGLHALATQQV